MRTRIKRQSHPEKAEVLTKAIVNLANQYVLSGKILHEIIGISESTISRLHQGKTLLSPDTKEGQMALYLIRVYRNLQTLLGGDHAKAKLWLSSDNHYFGLPPIEHMKSIHGLVEVVNYLDSMRGKS